jgi:hypothetical protein
MILSNYNNKRIFELIILGLWLCIALILYVQNDVLKNNYLNKDLNFSELAIKEIVVIDDNSFEVTLKDDSKATVLAKLDVDLVNGSKQKVANLLSKIVDPKISLQKQKDGCWIIKMSFLLDGKKTNLENWLFSNNLVKK